MSKIIAIWLGYGTAQFCSLSSIDFWQTEGKERTDGKRKKLSCWWWNTLSHWIIKMVLPSPEQLFRLEYKINTHCLFRKPRNTVNKNEHRVQFQAVRLQHEHATLCEEQRLLSQVDSVRQLHCIPLFGLENGVRFVLSYRQFQCSNLRDL